MGSSNTHRRKGKVRVDFDFYPEEKKALQKMARDNGCTATVMIRYLVRQAAGLPVMPLMVTDTSRR